MKTETHFFGAKRENSVFQTKLDLLKSDDEMIRGFTVTFWDRVFECEIPNSENPPTLSVRRTSDEEKEIIRKEGFSRVGKEWSDEELEALVTLFETEKGDFAVIAKVMERTERSVWLQLESMGLVERKEKQKEGSIVSKL